MLSMLIIVLYFAFCTDVFAQSNLSIVCVAGQCFQGVSNTIIGATVQGSELTQRIQLLPGHYTTTTNPQLLHNILTSRSSSLVGSLGFESASLSSLPLNLQLEPGVAIYSQSLYSGQTSFGRLPESPIADSSIPVSGKSIAIAPDVWIAVSNNNQRLILWDSVPDMSQLPSTGSLSLLDVQSSVCSPPCSSTSVCSASGTCTCSAGFTGSACESCQDGFFGPTCEPCPDGCSNCDQGMSGSGRCLTLTSEPDSDNLPASCNCLNGLCGSDGQCTCNNGWTTADNGTACAKCAPGFFLSTTGDCQVCNLGCGECTDGTGNCAACKSGFTQDANDRTKCIGDVTTRNIPCNSLECNTTIPCPSGTFGQGGECLKCSPFCNTCYGPTGKDCTLCIGGAFFFDGDCRITDGDGVCQGTNGMTANRTKNTCDSCGPKCTSCKIPNFYQGSNQLECTDCLPGFFLSQGKCVATCPAGTFAPESDNICTNCSSTCSTCGGSPDFCLTCPSGQFASSGKCISSCPSDSFPSSGSCIKCHPDCSTCSGTSFNQCISCPPSRPVLTAGRCLSTCSKTQFFDPATSTCRACDTSCSSCSGPGLRNCLGCSSSNQVLRGGSCVSADCQGSSGVIPGLGVCLSDLVQVPNSLPPPSSGSVSPLPFPLPSGSGSGYASPLPTVTGLTDPTKLTTPSRIKLTWWQILLMMLGGALILLVLIWCWRRWARKHREKKTKTFAREKNLDGVHGWMVRLGQRLFRGKRDEVQSRESLHSPKIRPIDDDVIFRRLAPSKPKVKEPLIKKRFSVDDIISSYAHSPTASVSSSDSRYENNNPRRLKGRIDRNSHSLYSGEPHRRDALQREALPTRPRDLPSYSRDVPVDNRFNDPWGYTQAIRPTILGDSGVSHSNHQSTLSRFPPVYPTIARPIGPTPDAVQQSLGGNHMPVNTIYNGRGPYMLPQMMQRPLIASQPIGASYSDVSPRNPFRNRGP